MTIHRETLEQYGISPDEAIASFQCSECGQWENYGRWKEVTRAEPLVMRYQGLKCPNCGHFHNPTDGPIRYTTAESAPKIEKSIVLDEEMTVAINQAYLNKRSWITCSTEFGTVECLAVCIGWHFTENRTFMLDVTPVGGFGKMTIPLLEFHSMAKLQDHSGINRTGVGRMAY